MILLRLILISLIFLFGSCQPNDTIILEAWDNQQPKIVHFYPDPSDRSIYEYQYFWQNGKPKVIGNYTNGKRTGEWKWKLNDGKMEKTVVYDNGKELSTARYFENGKQQEEIKPTHSGASEGSYTYFYESGEIVSKGTYAWDGREDKMHGEHKEYHQNGQLWNEGLYNMGKRDSSWNWYDSTGVMTATMIYDKGKRISSKTYGINDTL